jgi:SAM-dependent methyltransferase
VVPQELTRSFDEISSVYDETREPEDPGTLDALAERLRDQGVRSLLEIGVGTGRVAGPLVDHGFEVTGLDASRGMLRRAHAKGLHQLVRGSAYHLPFEPRQFDGALFVHVLHLLDRPTDAVAEARRVARIGVMAIVRPRPSGEHRDEPRWECGRRLVGELLAGAGYPGRVKGGPWKKEGQFLEAHPPDELTVLTDCEVTERAAKGIEMLAKRGSVHMLDVPAEVIARAVEEAASRLGDRTITYRQVRALALWRTATAPGRADGGAASGGESAFHHVR